jgi:3-hydroxyisobutyrate dehydrogenase
MRPRPRVGFIGLGAMGSALASRLTGSADLSVFDLEPGRAKTLVAAGARLVPDLAGLAARADVIITCLPTSQHVRAAIFDGGGLLDHLKQGTLLIDATSGDPAVTREMSSALTADNIALIDAPVSGGPQAATAGTIAILVGAGEEELQRARPVLELISPNIRHVGGVGSGHCVKALNNALAAGHRLLAFEATAVAVANGVDPAAFIDAVNISSGRSYATEITIPRHILGGTLDSLDLMAKDVALAGGLVPSELAGTSSISHVSTLLDTARGRLAPGADINRLIEIFEAAAQVTIATSDRAS